MVKRWISDYKPREQGLSKVLGNLESEVMDLIWSKDCEVCVRDIYDTLVSRRQIAYTTVMTIMVRLAEKNILSSRKAGKTLFFTPVMSREEFTSDAVGSVVDSLLEDFADATMAHLVNRAKSGDRATIEKLEKLLESLDGDDLDHG